MLTNQFNHYQTRFNEAKERLRILEEDPMINKNGFIYKEGKAQLVRTLRDIGNKMKSLGCDISIVTVTASIYKDNLLSLISIQFSGISVEDALSIIKLRYPTSYDHKHKISYTGKAIITPQINKSEFKENSNTKGYY